MPAQMHELIYYIYILLFGVFISLRLACGNLARREWYVFAVLSPAVLLLQGICLQLWDMDTVRLLYPLIVHLPMMLALMLVLRVKWNAALVSVLVSYSVCQLPRWVGLVLEALALQILPALLIQIAAAQAILLLLDRFCLNAVHQTIVSLSRPMLRFGALPALYYLYEYFMIYTHQRYMGLSVFSELLPTGLVLFFVLFVVAYQREMSRLEQARFQASALEMQLNQAGREISSLRSLQEQTAIYRHDFRHHLCMIDGMIAAGQPQQAVQYIRETEAAIDEITPERFCENETVNLLLSAFKKRAQSAGVELRVRANLPPALTLPDTELCTLLSNGLENAVHAASAADGAAIDVYCGVRQNQLLIEIRNPFVGVIAFENEIPVSAGPEKHYGCRSIQSIAQRRKGMCSFGAENGIFTLRIAIPLKI